MNIRFGRLHYFQFVITVSTTRTILDGYVNKSDRMCTDLRAYGDRFKSSGQLSMPYVPVTLARV